MIMKEVVINLNMFSMHMKDIIVDILMAFQWLRWIEVSVRQSTPRSCRNQRNQRAWLWTFVASKCMIFCLNTRKSNDNFFLVVQRDEGITKN